MDYAFSFCNSYVNTTKRQLFKEPETLMFWLIVCVSGALCTLVKIFIGQDDFGPSLFMWAMWIFGMVRMVTNTL